MATVKNKKQQQQPEFPLPLDVERAVEEHMDELSALASAMRAGADCPRP